MIIYECLSLVREKKQIKWNGKLQGKLVLSQYCVQATYLDLLHRTRNDLAEALELLKAQVDSNMNQGLDQSKAGPGSSSPSWNDPGV